LIVDWEQLELAEAVEVDEEMLLGYREQAEVDGSPSCQK
jgi:hypothetical protein